MLKTMKVGLAASALSLAALSSSAAYAECGDVTLTQMDWASSIVVTEVSRFLMEQGYGCSVTLVPSSTNPAMVSLAETNQPDIVTEIWKNSAPALQGLIDEGKVIALNRVLSDGGVEGWYVPAYMVEETPELATLEGVLANADALGGVFHTCPEGWGCKTINANLAAAAGLEANGFEIFEHGSSETLGVSISAAYEDQEPWLGYYWEPTSLLGKYPMVKVDMGGFDAARHECNRNAECAAPQVSDYPSAEVLTVVTTSFSEREPEVAELMANVAFSNAQMGSVLAWQEDNGASGEEAAVHFLTTYPEVWGAWINDAAREKLAGLLQ